MTRQPRYREVRSCDNGFLLVSQLSGRPSLPQDRRASLQALSQHLATKGETWRVAVKVTDPRGNEGMRVLTVKD
jgi:hypothetical protein